MVDIKLEIPGYHLVIFYRDFFTIDFYCKSGPFVMQNHYTSFSSYFFNYKGYSVNKTYHENLTNTLALVFT